MKKYTIGLFLMVFMLMPVVSFAQEGDVDPNPTSSTCLVITNSMRYRDRDIYKNNEVSTLQDFLQSEGYLNTEPTGYLGLMTVRAVKSFQKANNINPTGYVGPITVGKIKAITCGGNVPVSVDSVSVLQQKTDVAQSKTMESKVKILPVGTIISTPTNDTTPRIMYWWGKVNQHIDSSGAWNTDPDGVSGANLDKLSYCKKWFPDTVSVEDYKIETIGTWMDRGNVQEQSRKKAYYTTKMSTKCVQNEVIGTSKIKIISPNGGESWVRGENKIISWQENTTNVCKVGEVCTPTARYYTIKIFPYSASSTNCDASGVCSVSASLAMPITIARVTDTTGSSSISYTWKVGNVQEGNALNEGSYRVQVCRENTDNCDLSDSYFKIISSPNTSIAVLSPNGGETYVKGSTEKIKWTGDIVSNSMEYPTYDINLIPYVEPCSGDYCMLNPIHTPYSIAQKVVDVNYDWQVGDVISTGTAGQSISSGNYSIQVCRTGTDKCDQSDSFFTIK